MNAAVWSEETLSGWGRVPVERCSVSRPASLEVLRDAVAGAVNLDCVPRGLGRAYGDAALNGGRGVIVSTRLDRFLGFDRERGIVECEAGVSIGEIGRFLAPSRWIWPAIPGTRSVTVGGAIAADVHGKNHHADGTIGRWVRRVSLMLASGEIVAISPDQDPELYWATIGGMGLTGVIVSARIQLIAAEGRALEVEYRRARDLDAALSMIEQGDRVHRYTVAWLDGLASGRSLGRSVLMLANPSGESCVARGVGASLPVDLPSFTLGRPGVKLFNAMYWAAHRDGSRLVAHDPFFHPLDAIGGWNRIYGRRGFVQYQALVPRAASRETLVALLEAIGRSGLPVFLGVLKSTGEEGRGMLSFPKPGFTLALDIPARDGVRDLARVLDGILLRAGGRVYLAKDALLGAETFAEMYPRLQEWRRVKARVDPSRRFSSSLARRVGLVEDR